MILGLELDDDLLLELEGNRLLLLLPPPLPLASADSAAINRIAMDMKSTTEDTRIVDQFSFLDIRVRIQEIEYESLLV